MKYQEFKRQLLKAGLTVRAFAELIKQSPNSITNYAGIDKVPSHLSIIAVLLAEMKEAGIDYKTAIHRLELQTNKPRGRSINRKSKTGEQD
ncbi:MAG: XRE family transcriptional regulator [Pseudoalteromonas sp.]|uniref:XRE family transcriptional regulator n=1 Tax=Pseudoalteromonas TaxID=53246 RepID=UPI001DE1319D|nr:MULTISPECIES: XRE family transcriptional regulator [unclassified Pseudoalteromonas]MCG7548791.1 XRE family transcriptional regulator [Pseudoalteromonas sp. Of7M-16]NRA80679.1 XRE family transcriptional regulator [Pseudoalteromonas sp.]